MKSNANNPGVKTNAKDDLKSLPLLKVEKI